MTRHFRALMPVALAGLLCALTACSREKAPAAPLTPVARASPTAPQLAITAVIPTPTPEQTPTPTVTPTVTPSASPGTPTATPRVVNGLRIVDEPGVWVVREASGLRIRSTPSIEVDNLVGSVPQNTEFTVIGRVLNGQEVETGKGTVWLILTTGQYMYAAAGSVERVR